MKFRKLGLLLGIAPFALAATLLGACGGDDDDGGGGGGGTGSDEDFVSGLCDAYLDFQKDMEKIDFTKLTNEDDAVEAVAKPFENLAEAFEDLKPPKDLKDWHEDASKALNDAAKQLKDGKFDEGIFAEDQPFEDPPQDVQDRLAKIAEKDKDCQEADFDFGS